MDKWIKATRWDGDPLWVNMDHVWSMVRQNFKGKTCTILFSPQKDQNGSPVFEAVLEKPEQLFGRQEPKKQPTGRKGG